MPLGIDNVALASFMNLDDIIKVYNAPHHLRRPLLSANTERDSRWNLKWIGGLERAGASPDPGEAPDLSRQMGLQTVIFAS